MDEYRKYIEKDPAFERRFQQVMVKEPNVADCVSILRGLKDRYESHFGGNDLLLLTLGFDRFRFLCVVSVRILDSALVIAAQLSNRYITNRFLPDKAIGKVQRNVRSISRISLCRSDRRGLREYSCATGQSTGDHRSVRFVGRPIEEKLSDPRNRSLCLSERRELQLDVEATALSQEKDDASKQRLKQVKEELAKIREELKPLKLKHRAGAFFLGRERIVSGRRLVSFQKRNASKN